MPKPAWYLLDPAPATAGPDDLPTLLAGLNMLAAQLAQSLPRLAWHADRGDLPALSHAGPDTVAEVTAALAQAATHSELVAGLIKCAHLTVVRDQLHAANHR